MSGNFKMDDYVDVAQRIHEFYERFPEGSLQSGAAPSVMEIGGRPFVVYHALAYRTPDDPTPAHGWAWEPVPGPTQFTRDSELMNAETAAWGRAIVACGFSTKKIASAQEVRARQEPTQAEAGASASAAPSDGEFRFPSGKHQGKTLGEVPADYLTWYVEKGPRQDIKEAIQQFLGFAEAFAGLPEDDIPFMPSLGPYGI